MPYLAESFEHNGAYDEWTFKLREGIKFHDDTDLDATVVKTTSTPPHTTTRAHLHLHLVHPEDDRVGRGVDDLTVRFNMTPAWIAFQLSSTLRPARPHGPAQLDDAESCDANLIGTGPSDEEWVRNQSSSHRFPSTIARAPDGKPYPYLDGSSTNRSSKMASH